MTAHSPDQVRVIESYRPVDDAKRALREFESRSLVSESLGSMTLGLHGSVDGDDVHAILRVGVPIDGVRRIEYGDGRDHWETALLTTLIDGHHGAARALICRRGRCRRSQRCHNSRPGWFRTHRTAHGCRSGRLPSNENPSGCGC